MPGKKVDTTLPEDASPEYIAQWSTLVRCTLCDRPMRPAFTKASEWPATVAYGAGTRCKSCYNRAYLDGKRGGAAAQSVKAVKARVRGAEVTRLVPTRPRAEVAATWSEEERAAAVQVCSLAGYRHPVPAEAIVEAGEIMEMLGLFDTERSAFAASGLPTFQDPNRGPSSR
jgi:hypothetical protein